MDKQEAKFNILLVALNDKFCKNVAKNLADKLDMFFADCHELVVYDLINPKEVLEKCGMEYLKKRERAVLENCSEYRDTVISIRFEYFKENFNLFKNSIIVYLRLPEQKVSRVVNKIDYKFRDEFSSSYSDFVLDLEKCLTKKAVNSLMEKLGEYYEHS